MSTSIATADLVATTAPVAANATGVASVPAANPAKPGETSNSVNVEVDRLIIGRQINFPISDSTGVLLLAAGSVITSDLKRLLRQRGLHNVAMNEKDLANATMPALGVQQSYTVQFDTELTRKLDALLDTTPLTVTNTEAAVKSSVVSHGRKNYDEQQRQEQIDGHKELCQTMDGLVQEALTRDFVNGDAMRDVASRYLNNLIADVDTSLSVAFEACDERALADHSLKMSLLGMAIAVEMGLDAPNVRQIGTIGLVQDWGMLRVPRESREVPGPLADMDVLEIQKHPVYALDMLQKITGLPSLAPLVAYQVHERPDGSGYPRGRKDRQIHQFAKILHVADAYVALTSPRTYRRPLMPYSALECLLRQAKMNMVDRDVVRALLCLQSLFPIGSLVVLSNSFVGRVLRRNGNNYMQPIVLLTHDNHGQPVDPHADASVVDLAAAELRVVQALPTPGRNEIPFQASLMNTAIRAPI